MSRLSVSLFVTMLATMTSLGAQQSAPARPGPLASVADRTAGLRKIDGYFPALLGRARGHDAARDSAARHRVPVVHRPVGRPRVERHRARSRPGRAGTHREVPARGPARDARAGQPVVPLEQPERARAQVGGRLVRQVDPVGLRGRRRDRTARCSSTPPTSSCATSTAPPAACVPATTASTATAARSICPTPRASRRTPKWT